MLINSALAKARLIRDSIATAEAPPAASAVTGSPKAGRLPRGVGMWSLSRGIYMHMRAQQRVPALRWYMLNGIVQVGFRALIGADAFPAGSSGWKALISNTLCLAGSSFLSTAHPAPCWPCQASVFGTLSVALGRMSSSLWPGLASEGALYFTDLTSPAVYLETLSTPFGTLGVVLPLALVLMYTSSVDLTAAGKSRPGRTAAISGRLILFVLSSAGVTRFLFPQCPHWECPDSDPRPLSSPCTAARVPGVLTALRLITLPYYCIALLQPHATLLLWGTLSASHHALQLLMSSPVWAARAGMPAVLLPPQQSAPAQPENEQGLVEAEGPPGGSGQVAMSAAAQDAELLLFLGKRYERRRRTEAAAACFSLALKLSPDCAGARREADA